MPGTSKCYLIWGQDLYRCDFKKNELRRLPWILRVSVKCHHKSLLKRMEKEKIETAEKGQCNYKERGCSDVAEQCRKQTETGRGKEQIPP